MKSHRTGSIFRNLGSFHSKPSWIGPDLKLNLEWICWWNLSRADRIQQVNKKCKTWWALTMLSRKGKKASDAKATPFNWPIQLVFSSLVNATGICSNKASHDGRSSMRSAINQTSLDASKTKSNAIGRILHKNGPKFMKSSTKYVRYWIELSPVHWISNDIGSIFNQIGPSSFKNQTKSFSFQ